MLQIILLQMLHIISAAYCLIVNPLLVPSKAAPQIELQNSKIPCTTMERNL
jgi:hypothetical protein